MKVFHCDHCRHLIFFESTLCLKCGRTLAYLPEFGVVASLDSKTDGFTTPLRRAEGRRFRLCWNYVDNNICNWAIPAENADVLCRSCRFTRTLPDLSIPGNRQRWAKLETAKRRLLYTLLGLNLPVKDRHEDPNHGLVFDFLADAGQRVLTGHLEGVVTMNAAEADDDERERQRIQMGEPYRTVLGHFRHEVGHYFWNELIQKGGRLEECRQVFGDERPDYGLALKNHYASGPPADWQSRFVTAYAASHPWEDWAETWAHYLHITDALETAAACGVTIRPPRADEPALKKAPDVLEDDTTPFDRIMQSWLAITYVLNNFNRGLGLLDAYPFVLSEPAIAKLRFVHDTIHAASVKPASDDLPVSLLL